MRIYLASSWRNPEQPELVDLLRGAGHEAYDFRNPSTGGPKNDMPPEYGFSWKQTDPSWGSITPDIVERYKAMLRHPVAQRGFAADFAAMKWADTCVLALPCGRSAHIEAGWMAGSGRRLVVYMPEATKPCKVCEGTGVFRAFASSSGEPCSNCKGGGARLTWSFEPELMYLVGGDADVITSSPGELLSRLQIAEGP